MKKLLFLLIFALFIPTAFAGYSDVPINHEHSQGVTYLELSGAIDGGKYFNPDAELNRAAFFKILFEIFNEDTENTSNSVSFQDVPEDAWFAPYAHLASKYNLIGKTDLFEPGKTMSLVEGLDLLLTAYGGSSSIIPQGNRLKLFQDVSALHPFYTTIHQAVELGVMDASVKEPLKPYAALTRGKFADMIMYFDQWEIVNLASEDGKSFYKSDIFTDIWNRIIDEYYRPEGEEIDEEALFQAAIKGMLDSLDDPYTRYFSPDDAESFMTALGDGYEGIGAFLVQDDATGQVFITEFVDGSPAEAAGMEIGDEITAVDDTEISELSLDNIINRIKGPAETTVKLTIKRNNISRTFIIERAELTVNFESAEIIEKDVWYINIDAFSKDMNIRMDKLILELKDQVAEPRAIVIDLRGNGGGYLNMANYMSGQFVPHLTPLIQIDYGSFTETIYNGDKGQYFDIPTYILVDEFTASASEILAAAVQEEGDAVVIGKQTFGKGTTQQVTTYWDDSILKFTMAYWLSPQGNSIEGIGITPDILITKESETKDLWLEEVKDQL
jgi:C-terminal peptidase prc